ncbi:MAG: UvrD-helicase domain-containing protein, partial [Actinomycetota bacterium]
MFRLQTTGRKHLRLLQARRGLLCRVFTAVAGWIGAVLIAGEFQPTESQAKAINELDGRLFIAAGAGSGKTAVVARRFIEAVASGKADVDQILTITFTKKAAAEMMNRVREVLRRQIKADPDPGRVERLRQAYRNIERARISTMDSFYSRVLKANALAAGI